MPDFQATLIDSGTSQIDVSLDTECGMLTVEDNSNYSLSDEDGHLLADFTDYRQLVIKSPDGTTYGYDVQGGLDEVWTSPSPLLQNTKTRTLSSTDDDGVYVITLYTVPTYDDPIFTYIHTVSNPKCVFYNGKLWRTTADTPAGNPPVSGSAFWEEIDREDLTSKYVATATFSLTCRNLNACLERLIVEAVCACQAEVCDDDLLCTNHAFLESLKLKTLLDGVGYASEQSDFCEAENLINAAKSICNC